MKPLTRQDFASDNEVRWCPGCGDYAILTAVQKMLAESGASCENTVFISGIGCAGRFPYYMNTYGFHTIHGRAPAVATGLKMMRDDLSVWIITGDGDGLSIGASHLVHCLRRNLDVNILLFNNEIYGLTKGQFSPTSRCGQKTKTSPQGAQDSPLNPLKLALASGASFVARAVDKDPKHLADILIQAERHEGASFIEIYQNCPIFNDGAFNQFSVKSERALNTVALEHGMPLRFGEDKQWTLLEQDKQYTIVDYNDEIDTLHDSHNLAQAFALTELSYPDFPIPLGVLYQSQQSQDKAKAQDKIKATSADLHRLYHEGIK